MQRVTITIDDDLMAELDRIIESRGYQNRSEAIRDLARAGIREAAETLDGERDCVAALVYVYDHAARQLPAPADRDLPRSSRDCRCRRCTCISTTTVAWR